MRKIFYSFPIVISILFGCENTTEVHNSYDYSIEQKMDCFCPQAGNWVILYVQSDTISKAVNLSDNFLLNSKQYKPYKSIKELYALISQIDTSIFELKLEIDTVNNYPSYIYASPKKIHHGDTVLVIADVDFSYITRNYQKL